MAHISIMSPVYRGEKMVHELVSRIKENVTTITLDYEIILVNDASPDHSWEEILKECSLDNRVKGINLSRNYGQHQAILAGLEYVKGDWTIVMDCDLQDRPEEIPALYSKAMEGYDLVVAQRAVKKYSFLKKLSSKSFYAVFKYLSGIDFDNKLSSFGIYNHKVIDSIRNLPERDRFFPIQVNLVGFKSAVLPIHHGERLEGDSSYTLSKLLKLAFGILICNTNKPLRIMVWMGFVMSLFSMLMAFYNVVAYFVGINYIRGYTTTIFSIWLVGGLLMIQMGVMGIYLGKIFDQVKGRPLYLVMDEVNI